MAWSECSGSLLLSLIDQSVFCIEVNTESLFNKSNDFGLQIIIVHMISYSGCPTGCLDNVKCRCNIFKEEGLTTGVFHINISSSFFETENHHVFTRSFRFVKQLSFSNLTLLNHEYSKILTNNFSTFLQQHSIQQLIPSGNIQCKPGRTGRVCEGMLISSELRAVGDSHQGMLSQNHQGWNHVVLLDAVWYRVSCRSGSMKTMRTK